MGECGYCKTSIPDDQKFCSDKDKKCRQNFWTHARKIGAKALGYQGAEALSSPQPSTLPLFDGRTYNHDADHARLSKQYERVFDLMRDGSWRTLDEIARGTGDMHQSISARLRDMRKPKFGGHVVERQRRGDPSNGLFEYRLIISQTFS